MQFVFVEVSLNALISAKSCILLSSIVVNSLYRPHHFLPLCFVDTFGTHAQKQEPKSFTHTPVLLHFVDIYWPLKVQRDRKRLKGITRTPTFMPWPRSGLPRPQTQSQLPYSKYILSIKLGQSVYRLSALSFPGKELAGRQMTTICLVSLVNQSGLKEFFFSDT